MSVHVGVPSTVVDPKITVELVVAIKKNCGVQRGSLIASGVWRVDVAKSAVRMENMKRMFL